jgi:SOS-response transcriptional repressor LexA
MFIDDKLRVALRTLRLRDGLGQKEVAEYLGMDRSNYTKIETGKGVKVVNPQYIVKLATLYRVQVHPLMYGEIIEDARTVGAKRVPVINKSQCGDWTDYSDLDYPSGVADRYEEAPETAGPNAFYVIASGDSMTGSDIREGDMLLVDPGREITNGNIVLAKGDNGCTVKKFQRRENTIILLPTNDKHPPIILAAEEIERDRVCFYRIGRISREV